MEQDPSSVANLYDFSEGRTALLVLGYLLILIPLIALMIWFAFQYGARGVDLFDWLMGRRSQFDLISVPGVSSAFQVLCSYLFAVLTLVYGILAGVMSFDDCWSLRQGRYWYLRPRTLQTLGLRALLLAPRG